MTTRPAAPIAATTDDLSYLDRPIMALAAAVIQASPERRGAAVRKNILVTSTVLHLHAQLFCLPESAAWDLARAMFMTHKRTWHG